MDIDIDISSKFKPQTIFKVTPASMVENGELKRHLVGLYFQNIPVDHMTGLSAIPYKEADSVGYFKIDMLNLSILENFENKEEIVGILVLNSMKKLYDYIASALTQQETTKERYDFICRD